MHCDEQCLLGGGSPTSSSMTVTLQSLSGQSEIKFGLLNLQTIKTNMQAYRLFARQVLLYLKVVNFVYLISITLNHSLRCHCVPFHYFYEIKP